MFKVSDAEDMETTLDGNLDICIAEVARYDVIHGIQDRSESNAENLVYNAICLAGHTGKISNAVAGLWTFNKQEQLSELQTQIADALISLCRLIVVANIDVNSIWVKRFSELQKAKYSNRKINLKEVIEDGKNGRYKGLSNTLQEFAFENSTRTASKLYEPK